MKYSVIIPVYNAEKTLHRCVDSLLNQNYGSAELILINDGSKDQSGEICRGYASQYECIKYIEQANAGVSTARNSGLDIATGEYITFVDSDDYVLDGYFSVLDASDADFVCFPHKALRSDGIYECAISKNLKKADTSTAIILNSISDRIVCPWNKRFRRDIVESRHIRFKKDLIIGEDFIFGLEYMLCCASSQIVDRVVYCVDETGMDSITRAARYDQSQFVRMYSYAFDIAEHCTWPQKEKDQLIQLLDYLYCRTAFARTGYCLREKGQRWKEIISLISMFRKDYHYQIQPKNKVHWFMRWCIKYRAVPVFAAVGYAHNFIQKAIKK